jgi:hypothetical protein
MNPHKISSLMRPFLEVLAGIFIVGCIVTWISDDSEYDDDFSVTITYDCKRVLTERDYPTEVISECLDLKNELARKNR